MKKCLKCDVFTAVFFWIILGGLPAVYAEPITLDGIIEPSLSTDIGSGVPGILETVDVEWGDRVKKGQVLATLQSGVEKATLNLARYRAGLVSAVKLAEERLKYAKREWERTNDLYNEKVVPFSKMDEMLINRVMAESSLTEAKESKRLAQLEVERSEEILKRMTIRSPINGVVEERLMAKGEYVENQPIMRLVQIDPLYVEVIAPVSVHGAIRQGMSAEVRPESPVGGVHQAKVAVVDRVIDAASGTFRVRLELPNADHQLPAGLKCQVTFAGD